jgi:hypothetical protein
MSVEVNEFARWFKSRGEYYSKLKMKFYVDGEPYYSFCGAECSLRDYKRRKDLVKDIFSCRYIGGGGGEYDGGLWTKKETAKTIVFKNIRESFFQPNWAELKIHKDETKNKRHVLRGWGDGSYTVYPDQCGTPHIFSPIEPEEIENVIREINAVGKGL